MTEHSAGPAPEAIAPESPVTVHLTGFEPLGDLDVNTSWPVVDGLAGTLDCPGGRVVLTCEPLPATFADATAAARRAVTERRPDILVHVGVEAAARTVWLETVAVDWAGTPARLATSWHAGVLAGRLRAVGHRVERSTDAGRCVCNAALLAALEAGRGLAQEGANAPVTGLVHVPPRHVLDAERVRATLVALVGELAEQVRRRRAAARGAGRLSVPRPRRVLRVGLTGGIGSGKSTVARLLADHGAHVVDADATAREVVEPGTPGLAEVRRAFGPEVVSRDGSLDRAALASVVFADPGLRERLEAIVLPLVAERSAWLMEQAGPGAVAVYDVPLLVEQGMADLFDCVVVVEAPLELRLARLAGRGLSRDEAVERMSHQADDSERRAVADVVVHNGDGRDRLAESAEALWLRLSEAQAGPRPAGKPSP